MFGGRDRDEALVRRAQRGDRDAFDELVRRHRDRVYAVALRLTGRPADAEDALQDTFLNAYRALPRFDARSKVSTWLYRIASNASLDLIAKRRGAASLDVEGTPEPAAPHDPYVRDASRRAIALALAALPDEFREAVVLSDLAGLGATEIAELLGVPAGTVKSRVYRGRAQLAAMLREPTATDPVEGDG
jgi:RNA polymerase sigma-70 factor (ECF subfamily)